MNNFTQKQTTAGYQDVRENTSMPTITPVNTQERQRVLQLVESYKQMNQHLTNLLNVDPKNLPPEVRADLRTQTEQFLQSSSRINQLNEELKKLLSPENTETIAFETEKNRANFEKLLDEFLRKKAPILSKVI
jgi:flagellar basal body-associated protein FliL